MSLSLRFLGLSAALGIAATLGCKVDPGGMSGFTDHCQDLQGDATCLSTYNGRPFCSVCAEANQGCVIEQPAVVCRPGSDSTSSGAPLPEPETTMGESTGAETDATTLAVDTTAAESTGEAPCEAEGQLDPTCVELDSARPFCIDAVCVGCEVAGGDTFCGDIDALTPACDALVGECVPCTEADRPICGEGTPVCDASGGCRACEVHSDCPQSACHVGPTDPLHGQCFAPDEVIWVDNEAPCPGLGTEDEPACSLQDTTVAFAPGDNRVVRLIGGTPYAERAVVVGEVTVAILGQDQPEIQGNPAQQAATLHVDEGAIVYAADLNLIDNPLTRGVTCNLSYLQIEDSVIRDNAGWGIFNFEPCTLEVRRTSIHHNEDGGIRMSGGDLQVDNATIAINGQGGNSTGIRVINANADILYSTIAGNDGGGADSLECQGTVTGTLRNSLVVGVDPLSVALDCFPFMFSHSALDSANFAGGTNVAVDAYDSVQFNNPSTGDFRLAAPPLSPYGDIALWELGDPEFDPDGTARPTDGSLGYAGVDEP